FFPVACEGVRVVDVIRRPRAIGQRVEGVDQDLRIRINLAGWNAVARVSCAAWIADGGEAGKVSCPDRGRRHCGGKDTRGRSGVAGDLRAHAARPGLRPEEKVLGLRAIVLAWDVERASERVAEVVKPNIRPVV